MGRTKYAAAYKWVEEFNAIPTNMINDIITLKPEEWQEITVPVYGNKVYVFSENKYGKIVKVDKRSDKYDIRIDDGNTVISCEDDEFSVEYDSYLPMWGTMWSLGCDLDNYWLEEKDGLRIMSECGFRVYEHAEYGYFFGIDGAGYNFYEAHWIPLYEKRGLKWHDEEE